MEGGKELSRLITIVQGLLGEGGREREEEGRGRMEGGGRERENGGGREGGKELSRLVIIVKIP